MTLLIDQEYVEAEVYHSQPENDRYFVKVSFLGTGMYINSFAVMPGKFDKPYFVRPPQHWQGRGYARTVDFDKSQQLWHIIEKKALAAVETYKSELKQAAIDNLPDEDKMDEPVDLSSIPFD